MWAKLYTSSLTTEFLPWLLRRMLYEKIVRPAVFAAWPDPEDAHEHIIRNLGRFSRSRLMAGAVASYAAVKNPALERTLMGLHFPNPVGLGGGFDKNAHAPGAFEMLGFGFVEVGTVTWHAQPGNPRPRVFRYPQDGAIINRFGFNNDGAKAIAARLAANTAPRQAVLGISLGKSKITPLEEAVEDYLQSLRVLYAHGDYFAINVSSPNTPGLRQLQDKDALRDLLTALSAESVKLHKETASADSAVDAEARARKPILVKIAPDLEPQALEELLDVCVSCGVDGLIATNTTLSRDGLNSPTDEAGGLSGRPLLPRSLAIVRHIRQHLPNIPLIGVGGIMEPQDAIQMLDAGADLLQIYTGFIYKGPFFARDINKAILARAARLEAEAASSQTEAASRGSELGQSTTP